MSSTMTTTAAADHYYYQPYDQQRDDQEYDIHHNYYPHEHYAGYYYNWIAPLQQWGLKWEAIKDVYCPPQLDNSLQWFHLSVPEGINIIPLLGDGKMHCQKLARTIGATYLYYRQDLHKLEIWAQDITKATTGMVIYLNGLKQKQMETKKNMKILKLFK